MSFGKLCLSRSWSISSQSSNLLLLLLFSLSHIQLLVTPWTIASLASLSFTISLSLLKFMPIESVMPTNHLVLCHPLLLLPSILPSIRVCSNESAIRIRWSKYRRFSFSISPFSECSGLISFRIDWFDLLAIQGTLKILLQHHSLKASILLTQTYSQNSLIILLISTRSLVMSSLLFLTLIIS